MVKLLKHSLFPALQNLPWAAWLSWLTRLLLDRWEKDDGDHDNYADGDGEYGGGDGELTEKIASGQVREKDGKRSWTDEMKSEWSDDEDDVTFKMYLCLTPLPLSEKIASGQVEKKR